MRHRPDGTFKWIGHYMDHWAKFHVLFALMRKSAEEVALNLQNHVFAVLGIPRILHSDNGREFVNLIVHSIVKEWPGQITIVNGRPRNPKCQGLVEQGNHQVEKLLGARLHEYEGNDQPTWTEWLPFIQCKFPYVDGIGVNFVHTVRTGQYPEFSMLNVTDLLILLPCRSAQHDCSWNDEDDSVRVSVRAASSTERVPRCIKT